VRSILTASLVFVLASCPVWCATFGACPGQCEPVDECETAGCETEPSDCGERAPVPHPIDDDNCICNGTLNEGSAGPRGPQSEASPLPLATLDSTPWSGPLTPPPPTARTIRALSRPGIHLPQPLLVLLGAFRC
jgi:hypothetical protein